MTATDWQKLKQDASETIQGIDINKMNKDAYILYGASLAILDHKETNEVKVNMPILQEKPMQTFISHPASKSLKELAEDEISDAEMYYNMGEYEIAKDELSHADRFLTVLKSQANKHDLQALLERRNAIANKL